jgi:adenylate kinase
LGGLHLSMGDLIRAEIHADTPLGRAIAGYHDRGELVPLTIIADMARQHLHGQTSYILDGFPRDLEQARTLDAILAEEHTALDRVIVLEAPDSLLIERLAGRRQSEATGRTYHIVYDPPGPDDPGPFLQRHDDTPEAIRRRLQIYHTATEPLKRYYESRGLLLPVDASGSIDDVANAIAARLGLAVPTAAGPR